MPSMLMNDSDHTSLSINSSVDSLLNDTQALKDKPIEYLFCPDQIERLFKTEKEEHFQFSFYPLKEIAISASSHGYR